MNQLAIHGGAPVKTTPFGKGQRFGEEELQQLKEALEQNTLFYWFGSKVKTMCEKFAAMYGAKHCVAASSGTAAIHTALGALGVTVGDEVITSPVTDMGSVIGILYQNAIPVFADLDPYSYNMDPASIEKCITPKTKVILVVHLAGNPADMDAIMAIARKHSLYVVEDCAQSYLCYYKGRLAGTFGDISCFSLNDFKQISAGDGGMLLTNNDTLYENSLRFADKNYNRLAKDMESVRKVETLAPNYRMTELQGAVAIAQLNKLEKICSRRTWFGNRLNAALEELPGIIPQKIYEGGTSSFWFYLFRVDEQTAGFNAAQLCEMLNAEGIPCMKGYIPAPVYEYELFANRSPYKGTHCPFDCAYYGVNREYKKGDCPHAEDILETTVRINFNEFFTDADLADIIAAIRKISIYHNR